MVDKLVQNGTEALRSWWRKLAIGAMGLMTCFIGYHAIFGANGFVVYQQKKADLRRLQQEIQLLKQENAQREQRIKSFKTDPQTIEKEARERLRYARPGEVVYTLPPAKDGNTPSAK